jgi:hypothetical protein
MGIERLEPQQLSAGTVEVLGLSDRVALDSTEALAASLRRGASFLCPTTPRALVASVSEALLGLPEFADGPAGPKLLGVLDSLLANGDLIEAPLDDTGGSRRHLFLGSPSFIRREGGFLLTGVRPDGAPLLDGDLFALVEPRGYAQLIRTEQPDQLEKQLLTEGLVAVSQEQWLRAPRLESATDLLSAYRLRLSAAGPAGEIEGVELVDPTSDVRYYRGRWRPTRKKDDGEYLIRRPQMFGANLWCFAEISAGVVQRFVDLPIQGLLASGSDEGWRLQAALDVSSGDPQLLRAGPLEPGRKVLDLFAPLPSWSQRRLDVIAEPAPRSPGALFSYAIAEDEIDQEVRFLEEMMFLRRETAGS